MKKVINNLRDGSSMRRTALLLPMLLMPLGLMGVTTPSFLQFRAAGYTHSAAKDGHAYAIERQATWKSLGSVEERMAEISEANRGLAALLPGWNEELVVHGAVRQAANLVGLELTRVHLSEPTRVSEALEGQVVVERAMALTGFGSGAAALDLVDQLIAEGWPTCVRSFDANRDTSRPGRFGYELRLGIFHYAPAEDFQPVADDEPMPTLEEPIQ